MTPRPQRPGTARCSVCGLDCATERVRDVRAPVGECWVDDPHILTYPACVVCVPPRDEKS